MYVLLYVYFSLSGHILFVSARIPVRICTYPSPFLHVSRFVSARILVRIWSTPVRIFTYPVRFWTYPGSHVLVPCLCLHLQFSGEFGQASAQQASQSTTHTHNHSRTHVHCAAFFLRLRVSAGALPAQRRQLPALERLLDRACCFKFSDSLRSVACLRRAETVLCLHRRLIGREKTENRCQWP